MYLDEVAAAQIVTEIRDIKAEMMMVRVAMIGLDRKRSAPHRKYLQALNGMVRRLRGDVPGMPDEAEIAITERMSEEAHRNRKQNRAKRGKYLITRRGEDGRNKRTPHSPPP